MKRMILGLASGLIVWGVLYFLVWAGERVSSVHRDTFVSGLLDILPILLGGGVAGYIAGRRGLILGGAIGMVRELFDLVLSWYWIGYSWFWYGLVVTICYLGLGALGGYLGQRLARVRLRLCAPG